MKKQTLITTLLLAFSLVAHADNSVPTMLLKNLFPQGVTAASMHSRPITDAPTPAPILRYAEGELQILRNTFEQLGNGGYDTKTEAVCRQKVKIPVYDMTAGGSLAPAETVIVNCNSDAGGVPVYVSVFPFVALAKGSIFVGDTPQDLKVSMATIGVTSKSPNQQSPNLQPFTYNFSLTEDLSLQSMIEFASPVPQINCLVTNTDPKETCTANYPVYFSAVVKITDMQ